MQASRAPQAPSLTARGAVAAAVGVATGVVATWGWSPLLGPPRMGDFAQLWVAARGWIGGQSPYRAVAESGWPFPLYYPMPAVLVAAPFAAAPLAAARGAFIGVGSGLLAYAVTARAWWPLLILASGSYAAAVFNAQWSPWLVAAILLPPLGAFLAAKPNIGALLWCYRPNPGLLLAAGTFMVVSLATWPRWPLEWYDAVRGARLIVPPIVRPGGILLLAALLRWRQPDARLLLAVASIPHTTLVYETLPLFLAVQSRREAVAFAVATGLAAYFALVVFWPPSYMGKYLDQVWPVQLGLVYLPVLAAVLRRPNRMEWPAWLPVSPPGGGR